MKNTVTLSSFRDSFQAKGRQDQFSFIGLEALFNFLEEIEADTGEEVTLDVIALCCDFSEYESALACVMDCGYNFLPEEDCLNGKESAALEYLRDNTQVIEFKGGIIIQNF
jgi:hypothetical protein